MFFCLFAHSFAIHLLFRDTQIADMITHARSLKYEEAPDYEAVRTMLTRLKNKKGAPRSSSSSSSSEAQAPKRVISVPDEGTTVRPSTKSTARARNQPPPPPAAQDGRPEASFRYCPSAPFASLAQAEAPR